MRQTSKALAAAGTSRTGNSTTATTVRCLTVRLSANRAAVSWDMEKQFGGLAGVVNMWVAAGDVLSWLPEAPEMLRHRGDIIWYYSGPPSVASPAVTITRFPMRGWMWGVQGFVHWQTVD